MCPCIMQCLEKGFCCNNFVSDLLLRHTWRETVEVLSWGTVRWQQTLVLVRNVYMMLLSSITEKFLKKSLQNHVTFNICDNKFYDWNQTYLLWTEEVVVVCDVLFSMQLHHFDNLNQSKMIHTYRIFSSAHF